MSQRFLLAAAIAAAALCAAPPAAANGKFPASDQLIVRPGAPDELWLMTTFGVVVTSNPADRWQLVCEAGAGYQDIEPAITVSESGAAFLALPNGVAISTDGGCTWPMAAGTSDPVVDISRSELEPELVVGLVTFAGQSRMIASTDDASFSQLGNDLPAGFAGLTLDLSPIDGDRIYASGLETINGTLVGRFARSDDRGQTWTVTTVPNTDEIYAPYIGSLDPNDVDTVYVRTTGGPGRLMRTTDGGQSWEQLWESPIGNLRGFALSPDGQTIVVGTEFDGLYRSPAATPSFQQISDLPIRCLKWRGDTLYACVNDFLYGDGFVVGRSTNAGDSFTPILDKACIDGPLECDATTPVGAQCPTAWTTISTQLAADTCGAIGGQGNAGGQGVGGQTGGAPIGGAPAAKSNDDDGGGCGCRLSDTGRTPAPPVGVLGLLAYARYRRRLRPSHPHQR